MTRTNYGRYVHGAGDDDPVLWYDGAGLANPKYLHADQQGSIIATANSAGALNPATDINTYDEYGIPGAANTGRFGYTGQAWIPELGMYYYKARIYSPTMGRFLQTDPIGYDDQINLYAYVGNDPVNMTDPSGKCINDPQCDGVWSDTTQKSSSPRLGAFNHHYRNGKGADYFIDPSKSNGLEESIDIGTQIQQSVSTRGVMFGVMRQVQTSGVEKFSLPNKNWSFDPSLATVAGETVGRITGEITNATMRVSTDGSYYVQGQMTLNLGQYDFTQDGDNWFHNKGIWAAGIWAGKGQTFLPTPTRTYNFTATGRWAKP